jgi:importin-7
MRHSKFNLKTQTTDEAEIKLRESTYLWANRKQAGRIAVRFIQKYSNPKTAPSELNLLYQHIAVNYTPAFLEAFLSLLISSDSQFVAPRTCINGLKYLYYTLKAPNTEHMLQPYLDKLMLDIALPKMQLTPEDDRIWKEDPQEYIRR